METSLDDALLLARALWGVSSSPPMPRYPEYVRAIHRARSWVTPNPPGPRLETALCDLAWRRSVVRAAELPWHPGFPPAVRLLAALSSFTDDYRGPYPREFFPEAIVHAAFEALAAKAHAQGSALAIPDQLDCALDVCDRSLFGAAVVLHAVTRVLARGRDTRALPGLALPLAERLRRGAVIAPFEDAESQGGDPLGDSYHYWAMLIGGLWCADARRRGLRSHLPVAALLKNGSRLMWLIRDRLFGNTLFFGRHHRIDRLGFRQGVRLADPRPFGKTP